MTLPDLLSRLKSAKVGSRELDAEIHLALLPDDFASKIMRGEIATESWELGHGGISYISPNSGGTSGGTQPVPHVTASVEAVFRLANSQGFYVRTEPRFFIDGERVSFISHALRPRWADWRPDDEWFDRGEGKHADQVLSIVIAVVEALVEGERKDG